MTNMQYIKIYGNEDQEVVLSKQGNHDIPERTLSQPEFLIEVDTEGLKEIINTSPQAIRKITRIG